MGRRAELTEHLASQRRHPHLGDASIPAAITVTNDPQALKQADVVLWSVPTQHTRAMAKTLASSLAANAGVVSLAKGLEQDTRLRVTEILAQELGAQRAYGVLSAQATPKKSHSASQPH